jgi:alpha-amylase
MPWGERNVLPGEGKARDEALRADYKRLIAIRRAHPALYRGVHEKLVAEGDLLVFAQHDPRSGETVVVAVNRGETPLVARFPLPDGWGAGPITDEWNGAAVPLTDGAVETTLSGKTAQILVREARH